LSRFDDVSGGAPPDASDVAPADATDAGALEDAGTDGDREASPGCGCANQTIASEPGAIPSSLAVDDLQQMVYWTTEHHIERCATTGCAAPSVILDASAPRSVTVGLSYIAWVENDSAIWVLPKSQIDGGTPLKAANTVSVAVPALLLDDRMTQEAILFIDTSWIMSCPAGQVPTGLPNDCDGTLIAYGLSAGRGLVFDGNGYYYIAESGGRDFVLRCRAAGCGDTPNVLAQAVGPPQALAQDNDSVYWIEPAGFDGGAILSVPKIPSDGGAPFVVTSGLAQPEAIAADDSAVYFTDLREGAVKRVAKDGAFA
jgi:hypothetical protein